MNTYLQRRALATREAHLALLDLRKLVEEAAETTHAAELAAIHLAIHPNQTEDVSATLREVMERLGPGNFEAALTKVRETLETAIS